MNQNLKTTELRMPDVKNYLLETAGKFLEKAGFKFKKSDFTFTRKHGKNNEKIFFLFYAYFPLNYRFNFLIEVWNDDIEKIKLALPAQSHFEKFGRHSIVLHTKDFFKDRKSNNQIEQSEHDYAIYTTKDLFNVADELCKRLEEQILPLVNDLSDIKGIDSFFNDRRGWSVNTMRLNNYCSELIASKLNGERDFHLVYKEMVSQIKKLNEKDGLWNDSLIVFKNLYSFLN